MRKLHDKLTRKVPGRPISYARFWYARLWQYPKEFNSNEVYTFQFFLFSGLDNSPNLVDFSRGGVVFSKWSNPRTQDFRVFRKENDKVRIQFSSEGRCLWLWNLVYFHAGMFSGARYQPGKRWRHSTGDKTGTRMQIRSPIQSLVPPTRMDMPSPAPTRERTARTVI